MGIARRDLLPECNDQRMPLDAFQASWCSRCLNTDCTRSVAGKSKFDQRVSTWQERLFLNPPRMEPEDPRFPRITAQKFMTIDVSRTPEIGSAWLDPRDLSEPEPAPKVSPAPMEGVEANATKSSPALSMEAPAPSVQNDSGSTRSARNPLGLMSANAQDQSGKILPAPPSASITKRDPWAVPAPPDPADVVITPGATVKLRGSGV